MTGRLPFT
jgi:methylenetetrahydrofolate reductase (NADPH)